MSSESGLDDPNDQLEDTEVASNAPKDDDNENGELDDLFGDDGPDEVAETSVYGLSSYLTRKLLC